MAVLGFLSLQEVRMRSPVPYGVVFASLCTAASLVLPDSAPAATVDLSPSKDNTLIETPVGNSNGAGDGIYVGRVGTLGQGTARRGVLAFSLSAIPARSTINSVTLTLVMVQSPNSNAANVTVHRVNADWGEAGSLGAGSGAPALPGDATWIYRFFNSQSWTSAGGDFDAVASAAQSVTALGTYAWSGSGLVNIVQSWIDNPTSNFGLLLLGDETTTSTVKKFDSREGFNPPKLTVVYTPPTIDVSEANHNPPVSFAVPWPSPASERVHLSYVLPRAEHVSLSIQDITGRVVRRLMSRDPQAPGEHAIVWDGRSDDGGRAPSGLYFASLVVNQSTYLRRIPLVR